MVCSLDIQRSIARQFTSSSSVVRCKVLSFKFIPSSLSWYPIKHFQRCADSIRTFASRVSHLRSIQWAIKIKKWFQIKLLWRCWFTSLVSYYFIYFFSITINYHWLIYTMLNTWLLLPLKTRIYKNQNT